MNIFKVLLKMGREAGSHTKEYSVYTLDNVDNSGRPLSSLRLNNIILCMNLRYVNITYLFPEPLYVVAFLQTKKNMT